MNSNTQTPTIARADLVENLSAIRGAIGLQLLGELNRRRPELDLLMLIETGVTAHVTLVVVVVDAEPGGHRIWRHCRRGCLLWFRRFRSFAGSFGPFASDLSFCLK